LFDEQYWVASSINEKASTQRMAKQVYSMNKRAQAMA
jgi:hypothetical protein